MVSVKLLPHPMKPQMAELWVSVPDGMQELCELASFHKFCLSPAAHLSPNPTVTVESGVQAGFRQGDWVPVSQQFTDTGDIRSCFWAAREAAYPRVRP